VTFFILKGATRLKTIFNYLKCQGRHVILRTQDRR